jgi:Arc/MetJ family transcription regulator
MRTTIDIPEELLKEVMRISKTKTKTAAVRIALEQFVINKKLNKLLDYRGKISLDGGPGSIGEKGKARK